MNFFDDYNSLERVYGFVITFKESKDEEKCNRLYGEQWFLFDNREYRDKYYKNFILEAPLKFGTYSTCLFNSKGKTYEQLVDWIDKTFLQIPFMD